jgi:hypothetical protein
MGKPLRQSIELPIGESSISIDITFRVIEIIERHYDLRAEFVGKFILENDTRIKRTDVAKVIVAWIDAAGANVDREEMYEAVLTAPDPILRRYVGAIQGALWYSLKEISAEEVKTLARGENIREGKTDAEEKKSGSTV